MARKGNIVEQYLEAGISDRIDIILNNYRDFPGLIDGFEDTLKWLIISEKRYNRTASRGSLGIRVSSTKCSDPTADAAIENQETLDAIRGNGDLERVLQNTDCPERHRREACLLMDMREDYELVSAQIRTLPGSEREDIQKYLSGIMDIALMTEERCCTDSSARNRICIIRRHIKERAGLVLERKYSRRQ